MRLGSLCKAGDLILLNGPLGAGKTVLVQGIGEALGIADVTSPTFVISRIHKAPLSLIHVDAYRLLEGGNAAAYLDDLDLDTPRESAVTVIEWGGEESARPQGDGAADGRFDRVGGRADPRRRAAARARGPRPRRTRPRATARGASRGRRRERCGRRAGGRASRATPPARSWSSRAGSVRGAPSCADSTTAAARIRRFTDSTEASPVKRGRRLFWAWCRSSSSSICS